MFTKTRSLCVGRSFKGPKRVRNLPYKIAFLLRQQGHLFNSNGWLTEKSCLLTLYKTIPCENLIR